MSRKLTSSVQGLLLGLITGVAVIGGYSAIAKTQSQDLSNLARNASGWSIKPKYSGKWPEMSFTVTAENQQEATREVILKAKLVRVEFKGDPMSRVMRPGDTVRKELETMTMKARVAAGKAHHFAVKFDSRAEQKPSKAEPSRVSYSVVIEQDGKQVGLAAAAQ